MKTRQQLLEQEYLSSKDFAQLLGVGEGTAKTIMQEIRLMNPDPIEVRGYIHIESYIKYYKCDIRRFIPNVNLKIVNPREKTRIPEEVDV